MPSNPTRRGFIATSLVASAVVPISDVLAIRDIELYRLMQRREYLRSEIEKLDRQWALAHAKLPSWCRPGPKYRDQDGRMFGGIVGWPDAGSKAIRLDSGVFLARPSIREIFGLRAANHAIMSWEESEQLFRLRLKSLRERMRMRRRIEYSVGLPKSSDWLALEIELEEIEVAIGSDADA